MKRAPGLVPCLLALAATLPAPAKAKDAEAIRRDHLEIQRLNREAAARFARRDEGYRREAEQSSARMADYARDRAQYERDMAAWRRRVADCNAGDWSACDRR